jgi:hypothetical protein
MARPLRIEYEGALYHVLSRGDRREAIFFDEEDRREFLHLHAALLIDGIGSAGISSKAATRRN